jgi:hypothetical protein
MSLLKLILLDGHLLYGLKNPSTLFCKKDKSLLNLATQPQTPFKSAQPKKEEPFTFDPF